MKIILALAITPFLFVGVYAQPSNTFKYAAASFTTSDRKQDTFKYAASFVISGGKSDLLENIQGYGNVKWENCEVTYKTSHKFKILESYNYYTATINFNKANWKSARFETNNYDGEVSFKLDGQKGFRGRSDTRDSISFSVNVSKDRYIEAIKDVKKICPGLTQGY